MEEEKNNLNDKTGKISYKILTQDDILGDKKPEPKEIIKEIAEEIKPKIVEKIIEKSTEKILPHSDKKVYEEEIKKIEEKKEEREEKGGSVTFERILTEKIPEIIEEPKFEIKEEKPKLAITELQEEKQPPQREQISKEKIFYQSELGTQISKSTFSSLPAEESSVKKHIHQRKFILITFPIIIIIFLIILFKPHQKLSSFLTSKELPKEEITTSTANSVITFPSQKEPSQLIISPTTSTATSPTTSLTTLTTTEIISDLETTTETTTKSTSSPIIPPKIPSEQTFSSYPLPQKEFNFLDVFSLREILIDSLNQNSFDLSLNSFLRKQEEFGTKIYVNFIHNKEKISYNFLFDYFLKSSKINFQELKNNFTGNYAFIILYGYTRKYPIIVFEINDFQKVKKFNENWEKVSMANDLKTLFLGLDPGKINKSFVSKNYKNYIYRILNLDDNYKIIWSIIDKYLVYSTTEAGLKEVINNLE